jgi:hypothetical protein
MNIKAISSPTKIAKTIFCDLGIVTFSPGFKCAASFLLSATARRTMARRMALGVEKAPTLVGKIADKQISRSTSAQPTPNHTEGATIRRSFYIRHSVIVPLCKLEGNPHRLLLADCRLIEARLSLACIQNSAREFDAE